MKSIHSFDSFLAKRAEPTNESMSASDKDKIKEIMKNNKFMDLRKPLVDAGFKVDFMFEPITAYTVKKGRDKVAICNKRYADDYEFEHEGIVMGDLSESVQQGLAPEDDLKSNFRSWESDHDNEDDAEELASILAGRHPNDDAGRLKKLAYEWVGYETTDETYANGAQDHKPKNGRPSKEQLLTRAKKFAEAVKLVRQATEALESSPKLDYNEDIPYYIGKLKELLSTDGGEAGMEQLLDVYQREAVKLSESFASTGPIRRPDGPQKAKIIAKDKFGNEQEWWLTSIDPTHLFMSNSPDGQGMARHVAQFKDEPYYRDMAAWLLNQFEIDGMTYQLSR